MKVVYRGYEIDVRRERSVGGEKLLYFTIIRLSDGYICEASYSTGSDSVRQMVKCMKELIDAELLEHDPWMEKATS